MIGRWTREEDEILIENCALGLRYETIAKFLSGRSKSACARRHRVIRERPQTAHADALQPRHQDSNDIVDGNYLQNHEMPQDTSPLVSRTRRELVDSSQVERKRNAPDTVIMDIEETPQHFASLRSESNDDSAPVASSSAEAKKVKSVHGLGESSAATQDANGTIKLRVWTEEEDKILCEKRALGLTWKQIAEYLPGRSECACKGRYHNLRIRREEVEFLKRR